MILFTLWVLFLDIFLWQDYTVFGFAETIRVVKPVVWFLQLMCFFFGVQIGCGKNILERLRRFEGFKLNIYEFMVL